MIGEECEDLNENQFDGCFECIPETGWSCTKDVPSICESICGDLIKVGNEECDDGHSLDEDFCTNECKNNTAFSKSID